MNVLGINCLAHDTAAALVVDGQVVAFVEEERLSREKHTWKFPDRAIRWCLETAGLAIDEVDLVTFDYRPGLDYARGMAYDILPHLPRSAKHWAKQTYVDGRHVWKAKDFRRRWGYKRKIRFIEHHRTHAAAAFLSTLLSARLLGRGRSIRGQALLPYALYRCTLAGVVFRRLRSAHNRDG